MQANNSHEQEGFFQFGWWPEIVGLTVTLGIIVFMFALSNMA